jgi:NADPH:quinone reductase-like Zn-dependent oxidoreductase
MVTMAKRSDTSGTETTMWAAVRECYGTPDAVRLRRVEKPAVADDGVLVRVHAASVNRYDWYALQGRPFLARAEFGVLRPKTPLIGGDFSGVVEAVGREMAEFSVGDEVFGCRTGAFAEYVSPRSAVVQKPAHLSHEEAAAVPVAGVTALQGLRDHARVRPGQRVLVNGASGGVGTFAVQIAKAMGAHVTAVCSTRNVERAELLGADRVIDYSRHDFTRSSERYDVLFDVAGSRSWRECRRVLEPDGILVMAGVPMADSVLGPISHIARMRLGAMLARRHAVNFMARVTKADLAALRDLLEEGKLHPVVERRYDLGETADALAHMGEGHAQGKLVVMVR